LVFTRITEIHNSLTHVKLHSSSTGSLVHT